MKANINSMEIELYAARDADNSADVYLYVQRPSFDTVEPIYDDGGHCAVLLNPLRDFINEGALYKVTMKLEFIENPYEKFRKQ